MRALTERQHRRKVKMGDELNEALAISILEWIHIIENVTPKSLVHQESEEMEVIIYTDGYFPDARKSESEEPRIGGVAFARWCHAPVAFSTEIPQEVANTWLPRKTQIVMIEALALPVAAETFRSLIKGRNVLWLVDSDPVLGAAVKGHSALEDVCSGITAFWEIIRDEGAKVYLDRIPTDGNLSDGPSRAVWRPAGQCGWATVTAKILASLCVATQGMR